MNALQDFGIQHLWESMFRWPATRRSIRVQSFSPLFFPSNCCPVRSNTRSITCSITNWICPDWTSGFRNDATGAPAYPPATLLKLILFAYSRGIVSSRAIERACREHVTFIALCGDEAPHFTTMAAFIRELQDEIANVFTQVLFLCDAQGLIGREMFAIDGVKLPSNASKAKSGTRAEFAREAGKLEGQVRKMLARHRPRLRRGRARSGSRRKSSASKRSHAMRPSCGTGSRPTPKTGAGPRAACARESNRSDNESAKMATDKRVIQGYTGVVAVDSAHQIIVEALLPGAQRREARTPRLRTVGKMRRERTAVFRR